MLGNVAEKILCHIANTIAVNVELFSDDNTRHGCHKSDIREGFTLVDGEHKRNQFSPSKTPKGSGDSNNCLYVCMSICMERICNYYNLNFNCLGQLIPFSKNFRGVIFPFKFH